MTPLPLTFPHALVFWPVYIWAFLPEWLLIRAARRGVRGANSPDAGSYRLIVAGQLLALAGAFPLAFLDATQLAPRLRPVGFWFGLMLIISGSLLRRHCWGLLGKHFTADVRAIPGQSIVDRGAYRWIRHPSYLAGLLMFGGIGLALGSWGSLLLLFGTTAAVYHYRMRIEEQALEATLGEAYRGYKRTRKRIIPFVY